jgi:hypothetical protein
MVTSAREWLTCAALAARANVNAADTAPWLNTRLAPDQRGSVMGRCEPLRRLARERRAIGANRAWR